MKKLLRHLIPIILVAITFMGGTDESGSQATKNPAGNAIAGTASYASDSWVSDVYLYLTQQTPGANMFRVPGTSQRTKTAHKNPFEFIKAGKIIQTGICNFIHKESLTVHSSFIKPAHRLISLGKLII